MRIKYDNGAAIITRDDGGVEVIRDGDELIDPRTIDWGADTKPLTLPEMRTRLASLQTALEHPRERLFDVFLRNGRAGMTLEERAQSTTTSGGGYLVPASFVARFMISLKAFDPLFDIATVIETARGSAATVPVDDDTQNNAAIVAESGTSASNVDGVFDQIAFAKSPMWRSGLVRVSLELLADSAFNISNLLADTFARRMARGIGAAMVTKLLSDADVATTAAATGALTLDEVLTLMGALDSAHANVGSFAMNFATYVSLLKLKASTAGSFMVEAEVDAQGFPLLFGRRVYLSPSFPALGAGAKVVSFGNHAKMLFRQVTGSLAVNSFPERYAEYGQSAFESYWRVDSALAKSANAPLPVRLLACHS